MMYGPMQLVELAQADARQANEAARALEQQQKHLVAERLVGDSPGHWASAAE